jgi:hypothetical protein
MLLIYSYVCFDQFKITFVLFAANVCDTDSKKWHMQFSVDKGRNSGLTKNFHFEFEYYAVFRLLMLKILHCVFLYPDRTIK